MTKKVFFILFTSLLSLQSFALIEINGEYGLNTQKYGADRKNEIRATTLGAAVALYLFERTAIEVNYSQTETVTEESNTISIDPNFDLVAQKNNVLVYSYGIGLRQAFASRKARFRPSLSLGYARQFVKDSTTATFRNNVTGTTFDVSDTPARLRDDSLFGSFNLELRLTRMISLRGSVKTIFKAFEFDRARDNVRYTVGFSWFL